MRERKRKHLSICSQVSVEKLVTRYLKLSFQVVSVLQIIQVNWSQYFILLHLQELQLICRELPREAEVRIWLNEKPGRLRIAQVFI